MRALSSSQRSSLSSCAPGRRYPHTLTSAGCISCRPKQPCKSRCKRPAIFLMERTTYKMSDKPITATTTTRRDFLRNTALAAGAAAAAQPSAAQDQPRSPALRPNVLMICADQFRPDFIGANHENPSANTPHLDALAERGVNFRQCITNQPLCSPSRASFLSSRYATETGVWKLGLEPDHTLPTVGTEFRRNGYSTNFMGKWHVSQTALTDGKKQLGWVPPGPSRAASTISGRVQTYLSWSRIPTRETIGIRMATISGIRTSTASISSPIAV
jgi:hypothetical protein